MSLIGVRWRKIILPSCLLALVLAWFGLRISAGADFLASQKGKLISVAERKVGERNAVSVLDVELRDSQGTRVSLYALVPAVERQRLPAVIILGGVDIGKTTIDYLDPPEEAIVLSPDYLYPPEAFYSVWKAFRHAPALREATFRMIAATSLMVDYLYRRADVDTQRISLVGYSFGAPFVPAVTALDSRIGAAAIAQGGGDLGALIGHNLDTGVRPLDTLLGELSGLLLRPIEPLRYIDKISPRPLLMVNSRSDEFFPPQNAERLFRKAKEPKEILWLESSHLRPWDAALIRRIVAAVREWLVKKGML